MEKKFSFNIKKHIGSFFGKRVVFCKYLFIICIQFVNIIWKKNVSFGTNIAVIIKVVLRIKLEPMSMLSDKR